MMSEKTLKEFSSFSKACGEIEKKQKKPVITKQLFGVVTKGNQRFLVERSLFFPQKTPKQYHFSYSDLVQKIIYL
jgi:hypothetical protein